MKFAVTLSSYISKQFIYSFLLVTSIFAMLVMLIDGLELLRRASARDIPALILLEMVLLKLPMLLQTILPFSVLVSAVLAYTSLARRSELVVIRSAGVSVWEFLMPSVVVAFVIGVVVIIGVSPLSAIMLNKYEHLNAKYFENRQNLLDISETGLWIKQQLEVYPEQREGQKVKNDMIVHARSVTGSKNIALHNIEIIGLDQSDTFIWRIDAKEGFLIGNEWKFENAVVTYSNNRSLKVPSFYMETNLKQNDIQNSFADPQAISFFQLPIFISKLEKSGFSALGHVLQWHKILSSPFFYSAMVLIGAIFSLKAPRQGAIGYSITLSIIFGFIIYFLSNLVSSVGLSGSMPVVVSAWTPVLIAALVGVGLLLHYEDG